MSVAIPAMFQSKNTVLSRAWPGACMEKLEDVFAVECLCLNVTDLVYQAMLQHAHGHDTQLMVVVQRMVESLLDLLKPEELVVTFDGPPHLQMLARQRADYHIANTRPVVWGLAATLAGSPVAQKIQNVIYECLQERPNNGTTTFIPMEVPGDGLLKIRNHLMRKENRDARVMLYGRTNAHVLMAWICGCELVYVSQQAGVHIMPVPRAPSHLLSELVLYDTRLLPMPPEVCVPGPGNTLQHLSALVKNKLPVRNGGTAATSWYGDAIRNAMHYYEDGTFDPRLYCASEDAPAEWQVPPPFGRLPIPTTLPAKLALMLTIPPSMNSRLTGISQEALVRLAREGDDTGLRLPLALLQVREWLGEQRVNESDMQHGRIPAEHTLQNSSLVKAPPTDSALADMAIATLPVDGDLEDS